MDKVAYYQIYDNISLCDLKTHSVIINSLARKLHNQENDNK